MLFISCTFFFWNKNLGIMQFQIREIFEFQHFSPLYHSQIHHIILSYLILLNWLLEIVGAYSWGSTFELIPFSYFSGIFKFRIIVYLGHLLGEWWLLHEKWQEWTSSKKYWGRLIGTFSFSWEFWCYDKISACYVLRTTCFLFLTIKAVMAYKCCKTWHFYYYKHVSLQFYCN